MEDVTRFKTTVDLWVENSDDGRTWASWTALGHAEEAGADLGELRALIRAYTGTVAGLCTVSAEHPWFRVVMRGMETGIILAVVPRRWNADTHQYDNTGGEWMISDHDDAYRAWTVRLIRSRLSTRV